MKFGSTAPLPGSTAEADNATQGYCFRFHVTNAPRFRVPIAKPANYRRDDYGATLAGIGTGKVTKFRQVIQVCAMPNGRFELNSDHPSPATGIPSESLDLTVEIWDWPTATPARRRELYERVQTRNVGLIWLLQNDPEIPEAGRTDARQWGWHREEWPSNGHVPRQVYVRQGRRIAGEYLLTERAGDGDPAMRRTRVRPDAIAVIEWPFDPHGHHKDAPRQPGVREGYVYVAHAPLQVPYGVLTPRKVDGLLAPVACSCRHVAYNALRMKPVFMALGEACGVSVRRAPVTPAGGVERLGRNHGYGGKRFVPPGGEGAAPLTGRELGTWLRGAGYVSAAAGLSEGDQKEMRRPTCMRRASSAPRMRPKLALAFWPLAAGVKLTFGLL